MTQILIIVQSYVFNNVKHKVKMKDISQLRKEIRNLQNEKFRLELGLLRPLPMVPYSLIETRLRCGNKNCRCHQKGVLHGPYWYLTQHWGGKTTNIYVPREKLEKIAVLAQRYKEYETTLTRIRRLNQKILNFLKEIEKNTFVPPSKLNLKKKDGKKKGAHHGRYGKFNHPAL